MFTYPVGTLSAKLIYTPAFLLATGITDSTIIQALIKLETKLNSSGLLSKMKALYPFVGGTATTHKYNFMDSRDLDAAFRLNFSGGLTHSSTGVLPNGSTGYADTFLNPSINLINNNLHISFYSRSNVNTGLVQFDMGCFQTSGVHLSAQYNNGAFVNKFLGRLGTVLVSTDNADARGHYIFTKRGTGSNELESYKNGTLQGQTTDTNNTLINYNITLFSERELGTVKYFSNRECAFVTIGDGLTGTEISDLYTAIQSFQTSLSRQV